MNLAVAGPLQPSHLAVLAPAVGGLLTLPLVRRSGRATAVIALLAALVGMAAAGVLLAQQVTGVAVTGPQTIGSLPVGPALDVPLRLQVNRWNVLVAAAVAVVSFAVQAFARWYLWTDPRYRQFAATVGIFTAGMQLVVLSGDLLLTLVGWELMGWCSYLLIGHDSAREKARRAAYKSFLVTRLADAPLVLGFALLATSAGTTSIPAVVAWFTEPPLAGAQTVLTVAMLGVVCGVLGKSAQLPFQDWLPDAMEGPTPASALIHAATMVAAGTVVLAHLLPLLHAAPVARNVLLVLAGATAVLAAALAFFQDDLKRLLAWSTVSQVGLMLVALTVVPSTAGPDLAIMHLVSHAAFKALLFLMIGWLTVLVGGTVVQRMSGGIRRYPQTRTLLAIGLLALAGVPPTVGFVSKDLILDEAAKHAADGARSAALGFAVVALTTVLTAAYAMRAWLVVQHRTVFERRSLDTSVEDSRVVADVGIVELLRDAPQVDEFGHEAEPAVESDPLEDEPEPTALGRLGLVALGAASLLGGALVVTPLLDIEWQQPNWLLVAAALLLMLAAALLVRVMSLRTRYGDAAEHTPLRWRSAASRGLGVDGLYVALVARPVLALARLVAAGERQLDTGVSGLSSAARRLGDSGESLHRRTPSSGLVAILAGALLVALLGVALW
ncbi:NADH-quinone oxidoreductase subunit 5 family protein [Barrientosiimonas endolithica]|uniref:NADH-quinone oxidoreductase subunit L n=1 Tax=Barrientosiimonas endolithica TaxID=1535208 RepID=A0ABM8H7P6_9MICO|nr:NADH-quinone oxidoreductase subunit L [Barrientosiimonas endolithica]BDZ56890.1 hypothetical protein GCM10025872_05470 [Barrientosiimonas endolithica]